MIMNTEAFDSTPDELNRDKLVDDLKTVVRDAEELIKATADELSDKTRDARQRLSSAVNSAKTHLGDLEQKASCRD